MKSTYPKAVSFVVCSIILTLVFSTAIHALSASIGNARMILRVDVMPGKITTIERTIKVNNVNDVPVFIELVPADDLEYRTTILDTNVTIQPGESQDLGFKTDIYKPGDYEGTIGVKFYGIEDGKVKGSGVGLQSTIIIQAKGPESDNYLEEPAEWAIKRQESNASNTVKREEVPTTEGEQESATPRAKETPSYQKFTDPESTEPAKEDATTSGRKKANPVVGIAIIILVVAAGYVTYSLIKSISTGKK